MTFFKINPMTRYFKNEIQKYKQNTYMIYA